MNALNTELRNQARHLGLCDEWYNSWSKNWPLDKMVEKMYEGIDFCLEHNWPASAFIEKHTTIEFRRQHAIFIDDKYSICNPTESLVRGASEITFRYNAGHHGILYIRDNSHVKIIGRNRAFVLVHTFDKATVEVEQNDRAQIIVLKHSVDNTIKAAENVSIREEYGYPV